MVFHLDTERTQVFKNMIIPYQRKKILVAALALVASVMTPGFAQDGGVKVGFRGGYGMTGWQGETMKSANDMLEFTAGSVKT